jgi:chromate transporter
MAGERAGGGCGVAVKPSVRELAWIIARDVNRTVGGGMAGIELLRRSFEARRWVDAPTHGLFVAVSRLSPGTNVLAYCAAVGWRLHRWRGTVAALAAASIPASLVVFALAATLGSLDRYRSVRIALSAGMLLAAALVLSSAWNLVKPYLRRGVWPRAMIVAAVAGALYLFGLTPVRVLLVSALTGALLPVPPRAARHDQSEDASRQPPSLRASPPEPAP